MQTLTLTAPLTLNFSETSFPDHPEPGYALVRIRSIGICGTDIHSYLGNYAFLEYPRILGHELSVEVLALGSSSDHVSVGDLCAVEPYLTCGNCPPCKAGRSNCCTSLQCLGVHTDGGMREQIILPIDKLHLSQCNDPNQLALVEMLGVGKHAAERAELDAKQTVAILGLGPIGLSAAVFAQLSGARVIGVDPSPARRRSAEELLGIPSLALDPSCDLLPQFLDSFQEAPQRVIDASGNAASMQQAFELPAHGGTLVFVGLTHQSIPFPVPSSHRREMTTKSSRNCVPKDFSEIVSLIDSGKLDLRSWISHRCHLSELPNSMDKWLDPKSGLVKAVVRCD